MRTSLLIIVAWSMLTAAWLLTGTDKWWQNLAVIQLAWMGGIFFEKFKPEWAKHS